MPYAKIFSLVSQFCGRSTAFVLRWLLWFATGLLILVLALLLVLRLYFVPQLSDWRPDIERALSRHLDLDVQIASIDVESSAVLPDISLSQLHIRDLESHETQLLIPYAQVRFSFGALLRLGVAEILVRDMEMLVRRQTFTRWTVAGFFVDTEKSTKPYVLDRVFANRSIKIQNANLRYFDKADEQWTMKNLYFSMRNTRSQHRFKLAVVLPFAAENPIEIQGDFSSGPLALHPSDWTKWSGNLSVNVTQLDLAAVSKHLGWSAKPFEQANFGVLADIQIDQGQWQSAKGHVNKLTYRPNTQGADLAAKGLQIPSIGNANIDFEVTPKQGAVKLQVSQGWIALPGFLPEAKVPLDRLKTSIEWKQEQGRWSVKASQIDLENTDLALQGMVEWQGGMLNQERSSNNSSADKKSESATQGSRINIALKVPRVKANRVYRYVPLGISEKVRQYLQFALSEGQVESTSIQIQGPLEKIPFVHDNKGKGVFQIKGQMRDVRFVYIPPYLQKEGSRAWPVLEKLSGTWSLNGANLQVSQARALLEKTDIEPMRLDMRIPNVYKPVLSVDLKAQGALPKVLATMGPSALSDLLGTSLLQSMQSSGNARYQFALKMPLTALQNTEVRGQIALLGNDVKISEGIPWLRKLTGDLTFSERGFSITQAQAQVVGGPIQFRAELAPAFKSKAPVEEGPRGRSPLVFQASGQGRLTTRGLSEATELGLLSNLAQYFSGSTDYKLTVRLGHGALPEFEFISDLQGMASTLPKPFAKTHDARLPLFFQAKPLSVAQRTRISRNNQQAFLDHMELRLGEKGQLAHIRYTRDWGLGVARALQGSIAIGLAEGETPPTASEGVGANINIQGLDANAWLGVWDSLSIPSTKTAKESAAAQAKGVKRAGQGQSKQENILEQAALSFLPDVLALRSDLLRLGNYTLTNLIVGGRRSQNHWTATLSAEETSGFVRYVQSDATSPPSIYARLPYLRLEQKDTSDVKQRIQDGPSSLPNIDLVIDDLRLDTLALGKLAFQAQNRLDFLPENSTAHESLSETPVTLTKEKSLWNIQNFSLTAPEATLKAQGSWYFPPNDAQAVQKTNKGRTRIRFELETSNFGGLLSRFHLPNTVSKGNGKLIGDLTWEGSPIQVNYTDLDGSMQVSLRKGSLLQIDPGVARLLGLFSFQFLPRLLTLNADSTFGTGFAFDEIDGTLVLKKGVARAKKLEIRNSELANVAINGSINLDQRTQDLQVLMTPKIDFSGAALAASAINPALLILLPVQWFASKFLEGANIRFFHVTGHWSDPVITEKDVSPPSESKPQ